MNVSATKTPGTGPDDSSIGFSTGGVVGLTLFFLLLVIVAAVIIYKYHSKMRNILQSAQRRSPKKEDYSERAEADSHQYTSMITEQSAGNTPIYENLATTKPGYNRPPGNQSRSPAEPEEDLYLQCDLPDEAIYSNDPECNLAILPSSQEEDVYIIPES